MSICVVKERFKNTHVLLMRLCLCFSVAWSDLIFWKRWGLDLALYALVCTRPVLACFSLALLKLVQDLLVQDLEVAIFT